MQRFVGQLTLGLWLLPTLVAGMPRFALAATQDSFSPVPDRSSRSDLDEVDGEDDDADPASIARERLEADLAAPSPQEIRGKHTAAASFGIGRIKPWQAVGLELGTLVRPELFYGLYAGGGTFRLSGNKVAGKSYDLTMQSRGAGGVARYHCQKFESLAVEASAGLATWNGRIAPRGSDDSIANQQEKLTDSFHALGLTAGVAGNMNWVWENGLFVDWTIAGMQLAKVLRSDFSRDDAAVNRVVRHDIEVLRIYGIVDLKVGYYF